MYRGIEKPRVIMMRLALVEAGASHTHTALGLIRWMNELCFMGIEASELKISCIRSTGAVITYMDLDCDLPC